MASFIVNDKAKAKVENRYKTIALITLLIVAAGIVDEIFNHHILRSSTDRYAALLPISLVYLYILYYIFDIQPGMFNRIIQSIEIAGDNYTVTTFSFDIKYFPFKRKTIAFAINKEDVNYRKLRFYLGSLISNLPFANSYALNYNNKNYYLVPSLFNENDKVMELIPTPS